MTQQRRSLSFLAIPFFLLFLNSCAERSQLPSHAFEGTITEVIQIPGLADMIGSMSDSSHTDAGNNDAGGGMAKSMIGAAANMRLKIYVRGDKVAYDMSMLGGLINTRAIIDRNTRTMTMLMPGHMAMVQDLRAMDTMRGRIDDSIRAHNGLLDSMSRLIPQPTGRKDNIQGLEAEEYHAASGTTDVTMWLSADEKVKTFEIIRDAFLGRGRTGQGGMEEVFDIMRPIAGKVPVKFETKVNGKTFMKGELKDISEEKVDDSIFQVPQGYQIMNADSMRQKAPREKQKTVTGPSED